MVNCNLDKLSFLADVKNICKMYKCLFCCLRCSTIEITNVLQPARASVPIFLKHAWI